MDGTDLQNIFTADQQIDVAAQNGIVVDSYGEGTGDYAVFLFKQVISSASAFKVTWTGKSTLSCERSPIYLQALNLVSGIWENLNYDAITAAGVMITLKGHRFLNVSEYKNENNEVAFRVYQKIK